jgi:hypothetical protein
VKNKKTSTKALFGKTWCRLDKDEERIHELENEKKPVSTWGREAAAVGFR